MRALGFHGLACAILLAACQPQMPAAVEGATDAGTDAKRPPPVISEPTHVVGPTLLSETGLYEDFASRTIAAGVITFQPRYPLWSDNAEKKRFLALPEGGVIDTSDMDTWIFPLGTKLWKEFWVDGKLIETRLLSRMTEDEWWMVSYVWREDGSDADAVPEGLLDAAGTRHDVPSQNDCRRCHSGGHGVPLGVTAIQLSNGGKGLLSTFKERGLLSAPPAAEFEVPGNEVEKAALGYLHSNCGHCHNDHSGLHAQTAMRLSLKASDTTVSETSVYKTAFGLKARHVVPPLVDIVIVPGEPSQSQLWVRMALRGGWEMPPVGTEIGDPAGVDAVYAWISALPR